ncbi:putative metal-dependent HD superfamily phosphohydrolase [Ilumatobacter fluminis]|uniref:Putative metal-dependent HD superfamily phosphohydrolase n=1 Tax=Ilumatobacter fluminis TaxID=467091 RepID=A0A4V3EJL6_9ACTN|nr:HD domain-containing protein [Ilumatobacter fluminis]TDT17578.1 putative metal-dependent HD superfamily phosphohydrolase [Ilumatobacter fluminis]
MSGDERELHLAWLRHVGIGADAEHWFDTVMGAHRAEGRHYHTARHVRWVVQHVRTLAPAADVADADLDIVVAAAFFHDVVYDPTASDNETASAAMARRALTDLGWPPEPTERAATMIEATANHGADCVDRATCVMLAADLGVLAAEPGAYSDYVRNVRKEYGHLDDASWRAGRTAFVRSMLERASIFPASLRLEQWEKRARANFTAELAAMQPLSGGDGESDAPEP